MERLDRARAIANGLIVASVALAACVAAALAHVGIDVVGDFALARDAYDDVAHGSRAMAAVVACALFFACVAFSLWAAVVEVRGGRATIRAALDSALDRSPWRFIAAVVVATFAVLVGMETLDTLLQNGRLDDFADLLGGSVALAVTIALPAAIAVALALRRLLRALLPSCRALVAALGSFLRRISLRLLAGRFGGSRRDVASAGSLPCCLSLHATRRGPPLPAVAVF